MRVFYNRAGTCSGGECAKAWVPRLYQGCTPYSGIHYETFAQAEAACLAIGPACGGVLGDLCDGHGDCYACTHTRIGTLARLCHSRTPLPTRIIPTITSRTTKPTQVIFTCVCRRVPEVFQSDLVCTLPIPKARVGQQIDRLDGEGGRGGRGEREDEGGEGE